MTEAPVERAKTPLYLRATVMIGAACMLIGAFGLVWLPEPPPIPAFVRVDSILEEGTGIRARWTDKRGVQTEDGVQGRERDVWLFYRAPFGKPVSLQIVADSADGGRVIWQGPAILESGAVFVVER